MKLYLPVSLAARIVRETRAALPGECCGLLLGERNGAGFAACALHPAHNLSATPDRFEIAAEDHFAAQRRARSGHMKVIGCYHSHPDGAARPSQADLAGAGEQDFVWLIAGQDAMAAFVYSGTSFMEAELVTSSS